jgi:hypothetical protein
MRSVSVTGLTEHVMSEFVGWWIFGESLCTLFFSPFASPKFRHEGEAVLNWQYYAGSDLSFRNGLIRLPQLKWTMAAFQLTPRFMAPYCPCIAINSQIC